MKHRENAQHILEYVVVLTAIVLVLIAAAAAFVKPSQENLMNSAGQVTATASERAAAVFE